MDRVAAESGLEIGGARRSRGVRRFSHEAMATVFEVHAVHPDERYAAQAAQAAFDLVDSLERELSRFLPNSDIGRINHLTSGERTQVSPSTMECLVIARHMFDLTGGAFDVAIGTGLPSLDLDAGEFTVRATTRGVQLDLGGIGKGYAVDRMADLLEEWGLAQTLVHGGFSSILALESPDESDGWPLTLSDPAAPSRILTHLAVRQTALGASGLRKGSHILNPHTNAPRRGRRAAWAAVPRPQASGSTAPAELEPRTAAVTDALTTAFMLMGLEEIEALCSRSPGLEAWILLEPDGGRQEPATLRHFGGLRTGYTSTSL
jgi:FAD:protein FMN transferase